MIYLQLFWEFLKIGLFAVGGGMATLPFLQDLAESTGWYSQSLITDMIAISESTWPDSSAAWSPPWVKFCPPSSSSS